MAEIKKATPEKIYLKSDKGWESKYGTMYDHVIKFPGSDIEFIYTSKSKEQDKFKVGIEAEFEYDKKEGDTNGVHWEQHKIKPVANKQQMGKGGYVFSLDNEKLKQKVSAVAYCTSYIKDLISMDKLVVNKEDPMKSMRDYTTELISFMHSEIDKIK